MKSRALFIPALFACTLTLPAAAGQYLLQQYKQGPVNTIKLPATDSTDSRHKFTNARLLDAKARLARLESQDWTTVATDTAGLLSFPKADRDAVLRTFKTNIRPRRYTKGTLRLKSNALASVLLDGNQMIRKETADSASVDSDAAVSLNPEVDYEVQINLLSLPSDPAAPQFSLEFIPDTGFDSIPLDAAPDMKRRFEIEDINLGPRVGRTSVSPDGKYLVTSYSEMFDASRTRTWATLQETATGKIIDHNLDYYATWMPRGARLYWCVEMRSGRYDIYVRDLTKGATSILAKDFPSNSFIWSPDEKYIVYYDYKADESPKGTMHRYEGPDDRIPGNRDRSYLVKYELATGLSTPLTFGGETTFLNDISADSSKLLFVSQHNDPSQYPFYFSDVIQMDANTLATDTLIRHEGTFSSAVYSPDASRLFITAGPGFSGNLGKNCGEHPIANDFDIQGYIFDIASRKATPVTRDFNPSISGEPVWNSADNMIYFRGESGFGYNLYTLNPSDGKIRQLDTRMPTCNSFSIGNEESQWLSYTGSSFTDTGAAYLLNLRNGKTRLIDDPMARYLSDIEFGEIKPWSFTSKDGSEIDGRVCLPPDFDASAKYPVIVYYYGGTSPSSEGMHHAYTPQLLASRGYVVYVLNPSGTTGYGQEFSARHVNAWGDYTADEIIEGVKKFCKAHPFVDEKKIGCMGASYGGFMTQYLQTKTDIFAAAVSHAGISNVTSYWGEGFWGYSYNSVAAAKSYPWTNPELFTKHGSLFNADKIHTPLLLLHGTDDTNVPIGESIQLFNALKVLGREVEFITVDGQNHIITDYEKRKLWHATIMAWFAKYLQDDPHWWDSMYGDK